MDPTRSKKIKAEKLSKEHIAAQKLGETVSRVIKLKPEQQRPNGAKAQNVSQQNKKTLDPSRLKRGVVEVAATVQPAKEALAVAESLTRITVAPTTKPVQITTQGEVLDGTVNTAHGSEGNVVVSGKGDAALSDTLFGAEATEAILDFDAVALRIAEMNAADDGTALDSKVEDVLSPYVGDEFDPVTEYGIQPIASELGVTIDEVDESHIGDILALTATLQPNTEVVSDGSVTPEEQTSQHMLKYSINQHYEQLPPEEAAMVEATMQALSNMVSEINQLQQPEAVDANSTEEVVSNLAASASEVIDQHTRTDAPRPITAQQFIDLQALCVEMLTELHMDTNEQMVELLIRSLLPPKMLLVDPEQLPNSLAPLIKKLYDGTREADRQLLITDDSADSDGLSLKRPLMTPILGRFACLTELVSGTRSSYALAA